MRVGFYAIDSSLPHIPSNAPTVSHAASIGIRSKRDRNGALEAAPEPR